MLLAIDAGNSETKIGLFPPDDAAVRPVKTWRITTSRQRTADEYASALTALLGAAGFAPASIDAIAISSVVPQIDRALAEAVRESFGCEAAFYGAATQGLIEVTTERPKELGSDLVASAIAARHLYGSPLIVIGFGTATTFSAVSREGEYLGAAIAPGIQISIDALVQHTAKLPQVALEAPNGPIGRDTVSALQAGIVYGFAGQTEFIIERMKQAIGEDARVIATGGLADVVARQASAIDAVEPHLVLIGLRLLHAARGAVAAGEPRLPRAVAT